MQYLQYSAFFGRSVLRKSTGSLHLSVAAFESKKMDLPFTVPGEAGTYDLVAEIDFQGELVRSVRQLVVQ